MKNDGASSGDDRGSRERSPSVSAVPASIPSREKIARAMYGRPRFGTGKGDGRRGLRPWENLRENEKDYWLRNADAALAVMYEA